MPMWLPMPGSRQRQGTRKMPFERENYQFVTHNKKLICDQSLLQNPIFVNLFHLI